MTDLGDYCERTNESDIGRAEIRKKAGKLNKNGLNKEELKIARKPEYRQTLWATGVNIYLEENLK